MESIQIIECSSSAHDLRSPLSGIAMIMFRNPLAIAAFALATVAAPLAAQQPGPPTGRPAGGLPGGGRGPGGPAAPRQGIRPYADVITSQAKTREGLFKVHEIGDKVFYEIPQSQLGKELLWMTTFAQTQTGYGYGGTEVQDRVVRWVRRGDRILLRNADYQVRVDGESPAVRRSVGDSTLEPIIQAIDIVALGPGDAPVIDVTSLFTTDVTEFSARRTLQMSRLDASRTFLEKIKVFPKNIETYVLATYAGAAAPAIPGGGRIPFPQRSGPRKDNSVDAATVVLHHSLVALPDKPMKPRLADSRVGYFGARHYEFGDKEHRVEEKEYIARWRLEKKDPTAAVSEPVQPIVYYIGREVPEKWRTYLKQGVEDWQVAFEQAGFKNAIIAKDAPSEQDDPDWDPEDIRFHTIRWLASATENAYGPHVGDPRTGEILDADVKFFHNILKLNTAWYFVQVSPNDPRARKLPLPDEVMGDLLRYVCAHEVGHTLGLQHNMKGSSAYTIKQLRDPNFTRQYGTEASIMDYGRFNYVAQPGDNARLLPLVAPYDKFAIEWGYKPLSGASPEADKAELDRIAARQVGNPMLRFGPPNAGTDPTQQTEDLGSDAIEATRLGFLNLNRVLDNLIAATCKPGEDYSMLQEMYGEVLSQRARELGHVTAIVGGVVETDYHFGRGGAVFKPVPADRQRAAVWFLNQNSFATPKNLLRTEILTRIEASGVLDRILQGQTTVMNSVLSETRMKRMLDHVALAGGKGYSPAALMDDVRAGIWGELQNKQVVIDPYRRNLQRAHLSLLAGRVAPGTSSPSESRALARASLTAIKDSAKAAIGRTSDRTSRIHLQDVIAGVDQALDPD